jgi:hypothetical protein
MTVAVRDAGRYDRPTKEFSARRRSLFLNFVLEEKDPMPLTTLDPSAALIVIDLQKCVVNGNFILKTVVECSILDNPVAHALVRAAFTIM